MRFLPLALLLFIVPVAAAAAVDHTSGIHYGADERQIVDIYQPDICRNRACPVTLWVHGGGWRHGDMTGEAATNLQTLWAGQGIVMVGVNYRLSPQHMHPAHVQDVAAAINWVYHNIRRYGGDPRRISLLGHSAGAHLVALVATNPTYLGAYGLAPSQVLANVFPIDTASFDLTESSRFVRRLTKSAFGTDERVLREASPNWNVHPGGAYPSFIIAAAAARDDAVATSRILQDKLRQAGAAAELLVMDYDKGQMKSHGAIAKDLTNLDSRMTRRLLDRVLGRN